MNKKDAEYPLVVLFQNKQVSGIDGTIDYAYKLIERNLDVNKIIVCSNGPKMSIIKVIKRSKITTSVIGKCPCCNCPNCSGTSIIG